MPVQKRGFIDRGPKALKPKLKIHLNAAVVVTVPEVT